MSQHDRIDKTRPCWKIVKHNAYCIRAGSLKVILGVSFHFSLFLCTQRNFFLARMDIWAIYQNFALIFIFWNSISLFIKTRQIFTGSSWFSIEIHEKICHSFMKIGQFFMDICQFSIETHQFFIKFHRLHDVWSKRSKCVRKDDFLFKWLGTQFIMLQLHWIIQDKIFAKQNDKRIDFE